MRWCWMWSEGYSFSCFPGDIMFWALAWFSLDLVMFLLFFLFIKIITLCFYWQLRWWWHHINLSCGNISVSGGCGRREETREGVGRVGLKTTYEKNRVPRISSCSEPLLGFPSKLGHDTWTISSFFFLFTLPKFPCSWHEFLELSVCYWLLCLPFASPGHYPSVLAQPNSSIHYSWASSKRPLSPPATASGVGCSHPPFFLA